MIKKNNKNNQNNNYLDMIPSHTDKCGWTCDENNIVTLDIENKGAFNFIAQKLLGKPRVSHIHLDELGSCVYRNIDGVKSIYEIGLAVKEEQGEKAEPLYERLSDFIKQLEALGFVKAVGTREN